MGITCPDHRLKSWKDLVKVQGNDMSHFLWNEYSGNVPQKYYIQKENKQVTAPTKSFTYSSRFKGQPVYSLSERPDLYKAFKLLNKEGDIVSYPKINREAVKRLNDLNKTANLYNFDIRPSGKDAKYRIFIVRNPEVKPEATQGSLFQLTPQIIRETSEALETKLIKILHGKYGFTLTDYNNIKEERGIDALGFTTLFTGNAEIGIAKYRDLETLPEEAAHVFIAMLDGTPLYDRLMNQVEKNDYYKSILGDEFEQYNKQYEGNVTKLKVEALGKLLGKTMITHELNPPTNLKYLLEKVWQYLKNLIHRFPIQDIQKELNILTGQILNEEFDKTGMDKTNIKPFGKEKKSVLYRIKDSTEAKQELLNKALTSIVKQKTYFKRTDNFQKTEEYLKKQVGIEENISKGKFVEGLTNYLASLDEQSKEFKEHIQEIIDKLDNIVDAVDVRYAAKKLKVIKFTVDSNLHTLENIIEELGLEEYTSGTFSEESKNLLLSAEEQLKTFNKINNVYYDLSTTLLSKFMEPLLGSRNNTDIIDDYNRGKTQQKQIKYLHLETALTSYEGDINFVTRWLDSMAETPDDVTNLIDKAVKNQKIEANQESLEDRHFLLDADEELTKNNIKTDFVAEKDSKGRLTGYFVTQSNWGEWYRIREDFFKKLNQDILEKTGFNGYKELKEKGTKEQINKYNLQVSNLYDKYLYSPEEALREVEFQRHKLSKEEFLRWEAFNVRFDRDKQSYVIPKIHNRQYDEIQKDPIKKEYYDKVVDLQYQLVKLLPEQMQHFRRLPQIRQDFMERVKNAITNKDSETFKNIFREFKENFQILEDDDQHGMKYALSNDSSKPIKFLPIYYVQKLLNPSETSTDITSSMTLFSAMARDYSKMSDIIDILEIAKDVLDVREMYQVDAQGRPVVESIKKIKGKLLNPLVKPKGTSLLMDRIEDYYNMVVYGEMMSKGKNIPGTNINSEKLIEVFNRYVSINSLGFNLFAGIANVNMGKAMIRLDSIAGEFFNESELLWADKTYAKDLPNIINGIGSLDSKGNIAGRYSKINMWYEKNETLQDYRQNTKELNASRKNMFSRLFTTSAFFFVNKAGEHWLQGRTSLALANRYRYDVAKSKFVWKEEFFEELKKLEYQRRNEISKIPAKEFTKEKEQEINEKYKALKSELDSKLQESWKSMTNYYDAHEKVGRKLQLKQGLKDNIQDRQAFIHRQAALNNTFHGIYNDIDKSAAQQFAWFRMVNMFRKYLIPYWNRRFGKIQFNYEKDSFNEGYYTSVFNFFRALRNEAKLGEFSLRKNWATLSDMEKANFKRAMADVAHLMAYTALALILSSLMGGGNDDDDWLLSMTAYQVNRMVTEIGAMSPTPIAFTQSMLLLKTPFAGVNTINRMGQLFTPWDWGDEITRGRYKDYTKFEKLILQSVPITGQLKDIGSPEEKMVFFN